MAHSMYLTVIYGIGIVGIAALICLLWSVLGEVIKVRHNKEMLILLISSFMIFIIMGLTTDALEYTQISWFPFIFAGMAVSEARINE